MRMKKIWVHFGWTTVVVFYAVNGYAQSSLDEQKIREIQIQQQDIVQKNKQTIQTRQHEGGWTNKLLNIFNFHAQNSHASSTQDNSREKVKQLQADNQRKIEQAKAAAENAKRMQEQRLQMMQNSSFNRKR